MPLYRLKVISSQSTNLSQDRISWGWGIDAANDGVFTALPAILEGFELAMADPIANGSYLGFFLQDNLAFQAIEVFPGAGGEAVAVQGWTVPVSPGQDGASPLPAEVACCLSHRIVTPRGARPKGRTYLGPFTTAAQAGGRPHPDLIASILNFAEIWHDALVAEGMQPVVLSANGLVSRGNVIGYNVDNAWDTQRRRGWDATTNTAISV